MHVSIRHPWAGLILAVLAVPAFGQVRIWQEYPVGPGTYAAGNVAMGLAADGRTAVPCGSPNVATGCGTNVPPLAAGSTVASGVVATANAFQLALPANATRKGCLVVNKSTAPLLVFLGSPGSAAATSSIVLTAGAAGQDGGKMSCSVGSGVVLSDAISVTSGTAGAAFLVTSQ